MYPSALAASFSRGLRRTEDRVKEKLRVRAAAGTPAIYFFGMIVLDTNVISEVMKPHPSSAVVAWTNRQNVVSVFIPTIIQAEIYYGIECLPKGNGGNNW